jgi:hypothetical protein
MMGVGPTTWEEAGSAWSEASKKHTNLMDWIRSGDIFDHRDSAFNALARVIRIPLEPQQGVLALTVLERTPYRILDAPTNPLVPHELNNILKVKSFATVPLIAKDKAIGVVLVDNMFTSVPSRTAISGSSRCSRTRRHSPSRTPSSIRTSRP